MMTVPQLLRLRGVGAMKSFNAAEHESDERLFKYALPNDEQVVLLPPPESASKSSCASPKVRAETAPSPSELAARIALVLIEPVASPAAVRLVRAPQHG